MAMQPMQETHDYGGVICTHSMANAVLVGTTNRHSGASRVALREPPDDRFEPAPNFTGSWPSSLTEATIRITYPSVYYHRSQKPTHHKKRDS